jgi:transposase
MKTLFCVAHNQSMSISCRFLPTRHYEDRKNLSKAVIVLDHFHVKKYLNDAVDTVRREELREARQTDNKELYAILHCNKRFILMQNTVTEKKTNMLEKLQSFNPELSLEM